MRTVIVGAGPAGLFIAIALARRGREVDVVDRDPGPPPDPDAVWRRKGVMHSTMRTPFATRSSTR